MERKKYLKLILLQLFLLAATFPSFAANQIAGDMAVSCQQAKNKQILSCEYRNRTAEPVLSITANYADTPLTVSETGGYPDEKSITAVLFLVDTSDPARQNVINKNIDHIKTLLAASREYHRFGLASFDKELRLEAPIGSSVSVINTAAKNLKATGSTTELYRNMLEAIALFRDVDAARKSIIIFSDGLAEDKAYFHNDVVNAAKTAGVVITSIGYPRSVPQSVSLQTLRRLSEETGGTFIEANYNFDVPADFLNQPFASLDNGGNFTVALDNIVDARVSNASSISLAFETDIGVTTVPVTIEFNSISMVQTPANIVQQAPVATESTDRNTAKTITPIQIVSPAQAVNPVEKWLWYGIPVALFILVILTVASFFMLLKRQNKNQVSTVSFPEVKPYAFLITQDESKARYPITRTTCRLGRSKNNEITLRDSSVSRRHAEIHRDQGDEFTLIDLNSLNGVFVNNEKIGRYKLKEGDIVEIGDINLRFSLMPTDYQFEESTVIQDTRVPSLH